MQGISAIWPFSSKIRVKNIREFSSLQLNSLRGEQGINSGAQGIRSAEQGIWREIDPPAQTL
jgi:hypothetical protein